MAHEAFWQLSPEDGIRLIFRGADLALADTGEARVQIEEGKPVIVSIWLGPAGGKGTMLSYRMDDGSWRECFHKLADQIEALEDYSEWVVNTFSDDGVLAVKEAA